MGQDQAKMSWVFEVWRESSFSEKAIIAAFIPSLQVFPGPKGETELLLNPS